MVNCKRKGSQIERKFKEYFKAMGYHTTKAGGSFGIDLVCIKKNMQPLFVNVKALRVYAGPAERKETVELAKEYGTIPILAYKAPVTGKTSLKHCIEVLTEQEKKCRSEVVVLEPLKRYQDFFENPDCRKIPETHLQDLDDLFGWDEIPSYIHRGG